MERTRGILSPSEYRQPGYRIIYALIMGIGILLALVMLFPILWVFLSSLKPSADIYKVPNPLFPSVWQWRNFAKAWIDFRFPAMFLNTFLVYLGVLTLRLFVVFTAAYALSKLDVPFRRGFYLMFLSTLILPAMAYIIPSFLVVNGLGLINSWWAIWLPSAASSFPILLAKGFLDEIPIELSEASRMDGASDIRILKDVMLPNAKPIVAVIAILAFLEVWNNFFWPKLVLPEQKNWILPVMLYWKSNAIGGNPEVNVQLAGMFVSLVPPFFIFLFFQKYITQGITFSGLKG